MIKLGSPYIGKSEIEAVSNVLRSGNLVQGTNVKAFEEKIQQYLGVKHAFAVSSGTAALHIAAMILDIKPGDEVIVPDYTYPATANVFEQLGAKVKLVDIDITTLQIDVNKIEEAISKNTKAIVPVHQFGNVASMDAITKIASKYGLKIIEDAACAFGAEYKGEKVGTIGDLGCFSFHPRKSITTGEGGVIVTDNDELAQKISLLRNHGVSYNNDKMEFVTWGLNYRLTEIQAAIGICQINKITEIQDKLNSLAEYYNELLSRQKVVELIKQYDGCTRVNQTYFIICNSNEEREKLKFNLKEHEIETSIGSHALHCQPYFMKKYGLNDSCKFENAKKAYMNGLALPLHMNMNTEDVEIICNIIFKVFKKN